MRDRATVLCVKDGKFLAVQEKGQTHFSLPGGGIHKGEASIVAALRELKEETGLGAISITYLTSFPGRRGLHKVFTVIPSEVNTKRQHSEISRIKWFDMESDITTDMFQGHVIRSIQAMRWMYG